MACGVVEEASRLDHQALQEPGGAILRGDGHPVAHHPPRRIPFGEPLGILHQLLPGLGGLFRVQPGLAEGLLVGVKDGGGALEGKAVDLAVQGGVHHEGGEEVPHRLLELGVLGQVGVKGLDGVHGQKGIELLGEEDGGVGRVPRPDGGHHLGLVLLVVPPEDGVHPDAEVFPIELPHVALDEPGQGSRHPHGVVEGEGGLLG